MASRTLVIIGGALAGPTAAARARETDEHARIILLERNRDVSYAVGGLASYLAGETTTIEALNTQRTAFFRERYAVDARTGVAAVRIDPENHQVHLDAGDVQPYDALVYALGAASVMPDLPGLADAANVWRFRTLRDLEGIEALLDAGGRRIAILGGGFFGIEAADALLRRGCNVTLLERGSTLLPSFSTAMARRAAEALQAAGADVRTEATVRAAVREQDRVVALEMDGAEALSTDLVIVAAGVRPRTRLLAEAGAQLRPDGSVPIDAHCRTTLPDVFACGVCVAPRHALTNRPRWMAQAALADRTAQVAGTCAAGGNAVMQPMLGTSIVRAGALTVARTGLLPDDPYDGGPTTLVHVHAPSHDAFFTDTDTLSLDLVYDQASGRVLCAEVAGRHGVDKRIDVLATAIYAGMTVDKLAALDLAYAPPFAPTRDPINVAGTIAEAVRAGRATPWTAAHLARHAADVVVVDVRPAAAHNTPTIQGAVRLPLSELRRRHAELPSDRPLVLVSNTGRSAYLGCRILAQRTDATVAFLSGGLRTWTAEGYPLA